MASKTTTLTFRVDAQLKEMLRTMAELEHRSISNMIEVLILRNAEANGVQVIRGTENGVLRGRKGAKSHG